MKRLKAETQTFPSKKSFLRTLRNIFLFLLIGGLMIVAFLIGRLSMHPQFVTLTPKQEHSIMPGASPEDITRQFLNAGQAHDDKQALALRHPGLPDHEFVDFLADAPKFFSSLSEIKTLSIEELAEVHLSFTEKNSRMHSARLVLKKYQGEWRVFSLQDL